MSKNSYWMWHYGDYEIYHTMQLHLRRQEQGHFYPPFWKISQPYASVKFKKSFFCERGFVICRINGEGYVCVDGKNFSPDTSIELSLGQHTVEINVFNNGGLPAAFVESDVCPSDGTWHCNHFAGELSPVGFNELFDSKDKNPEIFPFSYIRKEPVAKTALSDGILYDFATELFGYLNIRHTSVADSLGVFYGESREEASDTEHTYIYEVISGKIHTGCAKGHSDTYMLRAQPKRPKCRPITNIFRLKKRATLNATMTCLTAYTVPRNTPSGLIAGKPFWTELKETDGSGQEMLIKAPA